MLLRVAVLSDPRREATRRRLGVRAGSPATVLEALLLDGGETSPPWLAAEHLTVRQPRDTPRITAWPRERTAGGRRPG